MRAETSHSVEEEDGIKTESDTQRGHGPLFCSLPIVSYLSRMVLQDKRSHSVSCRRIHRVNLRRRRLHKLQNNEQKQNVLTIKLKIVPYTQDSCFVPCVRDKTIPRASVLAVKSMFRWMCTSGAVSSITGRGGGAWARYSDCWEYTTGFWSIGA